MAITLCFQCCLKFTERFKPMDSVLNTSAITAVTKSFMKPQSGTTVNVTGSWKTYLLGTSIWWYKHSYISVQKGVEFLKLNNKKA